MSVPVPRSLFVSMTGWSLIVLGILGVLVAALVGFAWLVLLNADASDLSATMPLFGWMPPSLQLILRHLGVVCLLLLGMSLAAIPLGQALLQRRPWARSASVWTCAVLALLHFGALPWQWFEIDRWFADVNQQLPWFVRDGVASMYWTTQISGAVFALAFGLAFAWTAWKLATPAIRAEFIQIE